MHDQDHELVALALQVAQEALTTVKPLASPAPAAEIYAGLEGTITDGGIGNVGAIDVLRDVIAANCMNVSSPNVWAFIPSAATPASLVADMMLSSMNVIGDWWLEGAGAIAAENHALAWLCAEAGLGEYAGGVFVSGATPGNLAGLAAARRWWRSQNPGHARDRLAIACPQQAHSSIRMVASVLDCDVVIVDGDEYGRMRAADLEAALAAHRAADGAPVFAISATAGTTNLGMVDDLAGLADVAEREGLWLHVDGAYGGAALLSPLGRPALAGLERVQSMVVDPHKWLFAGYDCCALLYRDVRIARAAFTQTAEYLDAVEVTRGGVQPQRLRGPPDPPRSWRAVLVQPRGARRRRLPPGGDDVHRDGSGVHRRDRRRAPRGGLRPDHVVDRHLRPSRLGARRLRTLEHGPPRGRRLLHRGQRVPRQPAVARLHRQPADDARAAGSRSRHAALTGACLTRRWGSVGAGAGRRSGRWGG